jgi:putative aldouronate transport system permease protein
MANMLYSKQQLAQVIKYGVMIVSSLPVIIVYPFLQKYFVKGMMVGSIKG